jgi:hypothetical protein
MSSKKNKHRSGFTSQGVRDLSYIKGKSVGIKLEMPPGEACSHPAAHMHRLPEIGYMQCRKCGTIIDEDGIEI